MNSFILNLNLLQYGISFYMQYLAHWPEYFQVVEAPNGEIMGYSKYIFNIYYCQVCKFHANQVRLYNNYTFLLEIKNTFGTLLLWVPHIHFHLIFILKYNFTCIKFCFTEDLCNLVKLFIHTNPTKSTSKVKLHTFFTALCRLLVWYGCDVG